MRRLTVDPHFPDFGVLEDAAAVLCRGGLVAFPTETVYGLGANGLDPQAVRGIFRAKGRPADNPLILHVATVADVATVARLDSRARDLFLRFAPGPLTLVLPALPGVPREVTAGLDTVAVRIPNHAVALGLLRVFGYPLAAPSANSSGRPSPTTADAVVEDLGGGIDVILDGGSTVVGVESTVVDATGDALVLLRPGGLAVEDLEAVAGPVVLANGKETMRRSPGTRHRHYAPSVPVVLWDSSGNFKKLLEGESFPQRWGYVGMAPAPIGCVAERRFASLDTYAAGFFAALRALERLPLDAILAEFPSDTGIGRALQDRLRRAAEPESPRS